MMMWLLALLSAAGLGSGPTTSITSSTPHLTLQAIVEPDVVKPNSELTITYTVMPARGVRIYAAGSQYQPVAIELDPRPGVVARKVVFPPSEMYHFEPLDERVPVYQKPFTLKQALRVGAAAVKGRKMLTISGRLAYQACNDTVCFKPNEIRFAFDVEVKRSRPG
jgi:DsbC/DsbD-like thiol-disulfide interchange protein